MKNLILLALVICLGVIVIRLYTARSAPNAPSPAGKRYLTLTAEEAKARLDEGEDVVLLDVRTQEEYDAGHIPGAVCLPNEDITPDSPLPYDKEAEILVYCCSGRRSALAAEKLADMGYENVADFGGILDWPYGTTAD
nr:rhodanese-like domain-containing protein [uncultured Oscillibacter sp.]